MNHKDEKIFEYYNGLLLSPDTSRIRKLIVRYELFKKSLNVPGYIVECGVFKGTGIAYWLKLLDIFAHGSGKKVIGFDLFEANELLYSQDQDRTGFVEEWEKGMHQYNLVNDSFKTIWPEGQYELVKGKIEETSQDYVKQNKGFRISLLHLDLDVYEGTLAALKCFYPLVTRGGIIVIDEYAIPGWGESDAIDEFLATKKDIQIKTLPFSNGPTAYMIKS